MFRFLFGWLIRLLGYELTDRGKSPVPAAAPPELIARPATEPASATSPESATAGDEKSDESGDRADVFKPRERFIFSYWDGRELRRVDPMPLYKKVMSVGPELAINYKLARSQSRDALVGHDSVIKTIRDIFGVQPYDGATDSGLGELDCIDLLDYFMDYCDTLKKNSRTSPTSSPSAADSTLTSTESAPATSSTSDSGSTGGESPSDAPPPSSSGPA